MFACKVLLFVAFVSFTYSADVEIRIVNGKDTTIEEHPYQLSVEYFGVHFCGASLLTEKFVVTAAHCTENKTEDVLSIRAATSYRNYDGLVVGVEKIIDHPQYDTVTVDYDVSVLILAKPLEFSDKIQPIGLVDAGVDVTGQKAVVTGWGKLYEDGDYAVQLQELTVPIFSHAACKEFYEDDFTERMICAGFSRGNKDSCQADSGGPLVAGKKLVGIVSWGVGCARPNKPGIYTKVSIVRDFIKEHTGL